MRRSALPADLDAARVERLPGRLPLTDCRPFHRTSRLISGYREGYRNSDSAHDLHLPGHLRDITPVARRALGTSCSRAGDSVGLWPWYTNPASRETACREPHPNRWTLQGHSWATRMRR